MLHQIGEETEVLRHVVGLIENTTSGVFADSEPDDIRMAATLVRTASVQLVETSLILAAHLGGLRFLADLDGFVIEEPEVETPVEATNGSFKKTR